MYYHKIAIMYLKKNNKDLYI